ncbi:MAG TPA: YihY/virulence factor BrkB family protein [Terriglobales bacterium]|nr:YihY/virulence factor BrkB family protein [Terriglobales bacterium]
MSPLLRFASLLRRACWRAFEDDCFALAKAGAYSSVLTLFPALLVVASVLSYSRETHLLDEVASAVGAVLPPGSSADALSYFKSGQQRPTRLLISASFITFFAASGVMISWMDGFRRAYRLTKTWGLWKERAVALFLVGLSFLPMSFATLLVAFGNQIETYVSLHSPRVLGSYIFLLWTGGRWLIATLTSIAVISLIYHHGLPRTQPWHRVLPGACVATGLWFTATVIFAWYVKTVATYNLIYGSLGAAIALLVWMYILSIIVLVGAEFNAVLYPRSVIEPAGDQTFFHREAVTP